MPNGWAPYYGWNFYSGWANIVAQLEAVGAFSVFLPLTLVFVVVYAILERINLFNNSGVHMVIALVAGFFTITNPYTAPFFVALFQNLAWGIVILIVLAVLLGLAIGPGERFWKITFSVLGFVIFVAALSYTQGFGWLFGWLPWWWIAQNAALVTLFVFIAIVVFAVVKATKPKQ